MRYATTRPWDLLVVAAWATLTLVAVALLPAGPVRTVLGLPFVLFAPGYALVAALFPERARTTLEGDDATRERGIDGLERAALAFGLSIAVVPLLALGLNYTPFGIRLWPVMTAVWLFTTGAAGVAWWRRSRLPRDDRLLLAVDLSLPSWRGATRVDKALTIGLVLSIVVAGGSLAYVLTTPRPGEQFTEFYVLGPGGKAADYPTNVTVNATNPVILGIVNHEDRDLTYRLETVLSVANETGNGTVLVENTTVSTRQVPVADGATWEETINVTAPSDPGLYRLQWRLYLPDGETPYRSLHLWMRVNPVT